MARRATNGTAWTHGGRWSAEDARAAFAELAESGETMAAFARRRGLVAQRLSWWRKRLALSGATTSQPSPTFVPMQVRVAPMALGAALVVTLEDGVRVEVGDVGEGSAAWVAAFVRAHGEGRR